MNVGWAAGKPVPRKERTREGLREAFTVENEKKSISFLEIVEFYSVRAMVKREVL